MPAPNKNDIHWRITGATSEEAAAQVLEQEFRAIADEDVRDEALYNLADYLTDDWALGEAERIAKSLQVWRIEKTWLYGKIARHYAQLGCTRDAVRLLDEAVPIARSEGSEWQRAESLENIAEHLVALEEHAAALRLLEEAVSIARQSEEKNDIDASSVLSGIAQDLALAGEFTRAREVAEAIRNEHKRRRAVVRVSRMARFTKNAKRV